MSAECSVCGQDLGLDLACSFCEMRRERDEAIEALRDLVECAEEIRAHYGIEERAGIAQVPTEWDDAQHELHLATYAGREILANLSGGGDEQAH